MKRFLSGLIPLLVLPLIPLHSADQEIVYVNNLTGNDDFDGLKPESEQSSGPLRSIGRALEVAGISARIEIANTGVPYPGGNRLRQGGGTPGHPLVIEGHGAVISGLEVIPPDQWQPVEARIYRLPFWPMSNQLRRSKTPTHWIGTPDVVWMNGSPGLNCDSRETLRQTPGGYYWDKPNRVVLFHLPQGKVPTDCELALSTSASGLNVSSPADHVEVRNLRSEYSSNDGFSAHGQVVDLKFRNCVAANNCGQGFSFHGDCRAIIEDGLITRNASSGACDVNGSRVTYRRCVFYANSFEAGVYALNETEINYEDCLILGNEPAEQIWSLTSGFTRFVNCIIAGHGDASALIKAGHGGRVEFLRCLLADAGVLVRFASEARVTLDQCLLARLGGLTSAGARFDPSWISFSDTMMEIGEQEVPPGFPGDLRRGKGILSGISALQVTDDSPSAAARLPASVWTQFETAKDKPRLTKAPIPR